MDIQLPEGVEVGSDPLPQQYQSKEGQGHL